MIYCLARFMLARWLSRSICSDTTASKKLCSFSMVSGKGGRGRPEARPSEWGGGLWFKIARLSQDVVIIEFVIIAISLDTNHYSSHGPFSSFFTIVFKASFVFRQGLLYLSANEASVFFLNDLLIYEEHFPREAHRDTNSCVWFVF